MKKGQGIQALTLCLGLIFIVFVFALTTSLQSFADSAVQNATPPYPIELQYLIELSPFIVDAVILFGVAAALGRPSVGF